MREKNENRFYSSGSFPFFLLSDYDVKVTTGTSFWAGTNAKVFIKVIGTKGSTAVQKLVGSGDPFERGR